MNDASHAALTRREAIRRATVIAGGVALVGTGALQACTSEKQKPAASSTSALEADDRALVEAVADTLLPDTAGSPGAKAAGVGATMDLLLTDCYDGDAQRKVVRGLDELRARCRATCGAGFATLATPERERVLREIDADAVQAGEGHWFHLVRELSQRTYFSSEVGMTKALRWQLVPGRWDGCVPLAPGQPAWG